MNRKILLVATVDEAYHQLLLQSQGYKVTKASSNEVKEHLRSDHYDLVLVTPEEVSEGMPSFFRQIREEHPGVNIVVVAHGLEYASIPEVSETIIREQSSPAELLAAVRRTLEGSRENAQGAPLPDDQEDSKE